MLGNNSTPRESFHNNKNKGSEPDFEDVDLLLRNLKNLPSHKVKNSTLFRVKSANACLEDAQKKPVQKKLFGTLFFENEICILFSDSNLGKSILAVQIGESISSGKRITPFELEAESQKVLYFDFELSDMQFFSRYSEGDQLFKFHPNLERAELDPDVDEYPDGYDNFEDFLLTSLEALVTKKGTRVVIVDNITYLKNNNETAKDALPLMKKLKALKKKHSLSFLVVAHTPKRDNSKPICQNDLGGSKMLINFCDSAFAIGKSQQDSNVRYIKQIKVRNAENHYDADNIVLFEIKKEACFSHFTFLSFGVEQEHLKSPDKKDSESRFKEALELRKQGWSNTKIAEHFGLSEGAVRKWFKKHDNEASS